MSGVMIKLALYGLVRVLFQWLAPPGLWVGITLMAIGALSCVGGVLYALLQHELKRLLAFHSIENVGIVALGLGASLVFRDIGQPTWSAIAFAAALLHALNHALFKGLLSSAPEPSARPSAASTRSPRRPVAADAVDWLGVRARRDGDRRPAAAERVCLGVADASVAAAPRSHEPPRGRAAGALATTALAGTAALAVYCFVKVIGLVLLGLPRRPECAQASEVPVGMRASMIFLAGACVALGVLPGLLVPTLATLGPPGRVRLHVGAGLSVPGTGSLPTLALALALLVMVAGLVRLARNRRAVPAPTWVCGQPPAAGLQWTSAGFTKPLRLVLESLLRPRREVQVTVASGVAESVIYQAEVPHLFDTVLYGPVSRGALHAAAIARRVQSGSLRTYLIYLLALLGVLLALARTGVLG